MRTIWFVIGSLSEKELLSIVEESVNILNYSSAPIQSMLQTHLIKWSAGTQYIVTQYIKNDDEDNSLCSLYLQAEDKYSKEYYKICEQYMERLFFTKMRTERALGYDISCSVEDYYGTYALNLQIVSGDYLPHCLLRNILEFIDENWNQVVKE